MTTALPPRDALPEVFDELDHQLGCLLYLWALPIVSYAQWRDQHERVFGATDHDLVHYVTYRDRLGLITANATTPYILNFFDLSRTGPLVIELPPGPTAGGVSDFWQREVGALGEMGPDGGRGGTTLVVGPGQAVPDHAPDWSVLRSSGMNVMFGFRTLDPDPDAGLALAQQVRVHPFSQHDDPPETRLVSPDGRPWSGDQPSGLAYWARLHEVVQTEVVDERDRFFLAMLRQLGIEPGRPFTPDARLQAILGRAAEVGERMAQANTFAKRFPDARYWPDRAWDSAVVLSNSAQRGPWYDELLERASWFYEAVSFSSAMKSTTPGKGQAYLGAYTDADGDWLEGGRAYTLTVPAPVPAALFWSVTVYDTVTRCLVDNEQQRGDRGSRDTDLRTEEDGSVVLEFGPTPPASGVTNWIQTIPGQQWFSYLRLYGPLQPYFDRSWVIGDIEKVDA
ncbi:Uncharacterized conserved protein [Curtobacterium sp. 314Chir4.1]|uniref:DUF1254 domain-containing protein n=1 Tax=Curtobacterium sp. 314Chir4.1 TaxID=1279028 RepID=UPI000BCC3FA9|nr:DUF1254 domain-containing protein [Curtobacterium sp. 314Chir4.1]SOC88192.1 Uncharacterized conserved protein [Curtobacterium sp. 314Chir4.1]